MPTVLIAANPKSGNTNRQSLVQELAELLRNSGLTAVIVHDLEQLEELSKDLFARDELRAVVAAGGDGTISAVVTRIPPQCPIAILPLGSENLLAKHYSIPRSPSICAASVSASRIVVIDAMQVTNQQLDRPMIATLMASVGFDSDVVRLVHLNRKSHITRWAYRFQILYSWWTYQWPLLNLTVHPSSHGQSSTYQAHWLFVFNIPQYAAGLKILPDAAPDDGYLAVGFFKRSGRIRGIFQYLSVLLGTHRRRSDWLELETNQLQIDYSNPKDAPKLSGHEAAATADQDPIASLQVDGDWVGSPPASIELLPARIRLIVPS